MKMFLNFKNTREKVRRQKFGFTLIELLVVIAIIGLLSSVVLASLNSARGKARDARRKSDLNQVMLALNMYYDNYGTFCVHDAGSGGNGWLNYKYGSTWSVAKQLANLGYISAEARDPIQNGDAEGYMIICASVNHVTLWATMEGSSVLSDCYNSDYDTGYGKNYCISQ